MAVAAAVAVAATVTAAGATTVAGKLGPRSLEANRPGQLRTSWLMPAAPLPGTHALVARCLPASPAPHFPLRSYGGGYGDRDRGREVRWLAGQYPAYGPVPLFGAC